MAPKSHKMLPSFALLMRNYPHAGGPAVPKTMIGGAVNSAWITDTCAIRMSRALNYSGFPIPSSGRSNMYVLQGGDKLWYAIRVAELKHWLSTVLGPPQHASQSGKPFGIDDYRGVKGILALSIHYAARPGEANAAAGHIDLWDGNQFAGEYSQEGQEQDDFAAARDAALWMTPD